MIKVAKFFLFFFIIVIVLEFGLRTLGTFETYSEKISGYYYSYYGQSEPSGHHVWRTDENITYDEPEFYITYPPNSLGVRENEFALEKEDSVFRIITIGDSYTEGHRAPYDSTWSRFLENTLNETASSTDYEVLNCGTNGSDIYFMHQFLKDTLIDYKPDLILVLLNFSDIHDIILRGGRERFQEDGSVIFSVAPWFEPLYKHSHFIRMVCEVLLSMSLSNNLCLG